MQSRFEELKNDLLPRFWDTLYNELVEPSWFPNKSSRGSIVYIGHNGAIMNMSYIYLNPRFIPMKPTGLKDKNGKLIYENDVVIDGMPDEISFEVVFVDLSFKLKPLANLKGYITFHEELKYEIIGNIHSNPELVEVQK